MTTHEELMELVPDLVDDMLENRLSPEMQALLLAYPDVQRELEIAVQVRQFLVELQSEFTEVRVSSDFEARLLARVRSQRDGPELLSLSSKAFVLWLLELFNLFGNLLNPLPMPGDTPRRTYSQPSGA